MFHWICPECGREISPTVLECSACDPTAVQAQTTAPSDPVEARPATIVTPVPLSNQLIEAASGAESADRLVAAEAEAPPAPNTSVAESVPEAESAEPLVAETGEAPLAAETDEEARAAEDVPAVSVVAEPAGEGTVEESSIVDVVPSEVPVPNLPVEPIAVEALEGPPAAENLPAAIAPCEAAIASPLVIASAEAALAEHPAGALCVESPVAVVDEPRVADVAATEDPVALEAVEGNGAETTVESLVSETIEEPSIAEEQIEPTMAEATPVELPLAPESPVSESFEAPNVADAVTQELPIAVEKFEPAMAAATPVELPVTAESPISEGIEEPSVADAASLDPVTEKQIEPTIAEATPVEPPVTAESPVSEAIEELSVAEAVTQELPVAVEKAEPAIVEATPVELPVTAESPVSEAIEEPDVVNAASLDPVTEKQIKLPVTAESPVSEPIEDLSVAEAVTQELPVAVEKVEPTIAAPTPVGPPVSGESPVSEPIEERSVAEAAPLDSVTEKQIEPAMAEATPMELPVAAESPVCEAVEEPNVAEAVTQELPVAVERAEPTIAETAPLDLPVAVESPASELIEEPNVVEVAAKEDSLATESPLPEFTEEALAEAPEAQAEVPKAVEIPVAAVPLPSPPVPALSSPVPESLETADPLFALAEQIRAAQVAHSAPRRVVEEPPAHEAPKLAELAAFLEAAPQEAVAALPSKVPAGPQQANGRSHTPAPSPARDTAQAVALLAPPAPLEHVVPPVESPVPDALDKPPSGSWLQLAPLQDYTSAAGRAMHPAPPPQQILTPDSGPRITLPGPTLPPELASLKEAGVVTVLGEPGRKKRRRLPGWLVSLTLMLGIPIAGGALLFYMQPLQRSSADAKSVGPEAPVAALATSHPLAQFIEVTGFRIVVDFNKKSEIHYLVVNHSSADLSDVTVYVTLHSANPKPGQPPLCRFSFRAPSLGPFESKELTSAIEKMNRSVTLPEWQDLRADVQIAP